MDAGALGRLQEAVGGNEDAGFLHGLIEGSHLGHLGGHLLHGREGAIVALVAANKHDELEHVG